MYKAGFYPSGNQEWRCAVKHSAYQAHLYATNPTYRAKQQEITRRVQHRNRLARFEESQQLLELMSQGATNV